VERLAPLRLGAGTPRAPSRWAHSIPCFPSVAGCVLKGQVELFATRLHRKKSKFLLLAALLKNSQGHIGRHCNLGVDCASHPMKASGCDRLLALRIEGVTVEKV
jgi:hypothetical protein